MKSDIHPTYFPKAKVSCSCGHSFEVGSTVEVIEVEICSNCHPFFTGDQKIVDTAGRVEKFQKRAGAADPGSAKKKKKVKSRAGVTGVKKEAAKKTTKKATKKSAKKAAPKAAKKEA